MLEQLSTDQEVLHASTARFIDAACPLTEVRVLADDAEGIRPEYVHQAAELGWFASFVPEEYGGGSVSGSPVSDAAVVAYLRGRRLQPGAFVATNAVAVAIARSGSDRQRAEVLEPLVSGQLSCSWAMGAPGGQWSGGGGVRADRRGGDFTLSGVKSAVADAHRAQLMLVGAESEQGFRQFLVPMSASGITLVPLAGLDFTRRFADVHLDDVVVSASDEVGTVATAATAFEQSFQVALALAGAESAGAMDRLFEMTLEYAKHRVAFGRPIGSFQAIKHLLADLSLLVEASKAVTVAAVRAVDEQRHDAAEIVSVAKSYVGESGVELSQGCLQVHGGIGYTWEHDLHLYLRRLAS
ncbi:MAG: putative acyl-CoA dehydrogenase, partial [Acidimicrobiia bacterium]|nr:putative acyl-CoA dehydrogenase [Acidimicrobiia bacterium]